MRPETNPETPIVPGAAQAAALVALALLAGCGGGSRNRAVEADAVPLSSPPVRLGDGDAADERTASAAEPGGAPAAADAEPAREPRVAADGEGDGARAPGGDPGGGRSGATAPADAAQGSADQGSAAQGGTAQGGAPPDDADPLRPGEVRRTDAVAWPQDVDGGGSLPVARVGGQEVVLADMVSKWMLRDPDGVRAILDDLILSQVVRFEAGLLGIELPEGEIDRLVRRDIDELANQAKRAGAESLEAFIQARLGVDAQTFVDELAAEAAIDLLAPRCVRAWVLASERREFRIIAVEDEAGKQEVRARLDAGEDFADVARALSVDPTKEDGGRMAPVVRGDQPLARIAFATEVGAVAEPVQDANGFVFVYVESEPEVRTGEWPAIGAAVEESLAERPVEDPEYWQWKDAMFERYEIDISPFLSLLRDR